jgi:hypothetical protein
MDWVNEVLKRIGGPVSLEFHQLISTFKESVDNTRVFSFTEHLSFKIAI